MPVIVFANSKGGTGKSTSANLLATEFARMGAAVVVLDADANQTQSTWAKKAGVYKKMAVIRSSPDKNVPDDTPESERLAIITITGQYVPPKMGLSDEIGMLQKQYAFVIVDLEGTAEATTSIAISLADFVVIPTKCSQLDAIQATNIIRLIQAQEREAERHGKTKRKIPYAVLFNQGNPAIRTREATSIVGDFQKGGYPIFATHIYDRTAYRSIFSFGSALHDLDPKDVPGLDAAKANAFEFVQEMVERLRQSGQTTVEDNNSIGPSYEAEVA
jgi:chromosome partitioning protein